VLLFLPAFDEEESVAAVVRRAPATVAGHPLQVVVVDDGSTDDTADVARAAGADVHALPTNQGLGAAVRAGLALGVERDAAAVVFCDADGEYAPEEIEHLVAPILAGTADYVVGSRFAGLSRSMRPHRWVGNQVLTLVLRLLVRRWGVRGLTDGQSGYRALSPAAARSAELVHDFNYAQVLTLDLLAKGFRYAEVPITYRFREHGQSFVKLLPYLRRVVPAVWRELRSPAPELDLRSIDLQSPYQPPRRRPKQRQGRLRRIEPQSSTTNERNPSRAAVHVAVSKVPSASRSASAAAQPIAKA